ncbi:hypothetical protein MMC26_003141 [Xylographa opegraphella]|nr:hypothetical protein [Xylographa opegraphella]
MSLLRRMSQLGTALSGSRRRSNIPHVSKAPQESKHRRTPSPPQVSRLSTPIAGSEKSQTTALSKEQSTIIDETDIILHLLRMDVAMHSYFCFHNNPNYQYPGSWVSKTLQQVLTHVPILCPTDVSAYQDWIVSSAIDFIEQHATNIKRLTQIVRRVHAEDDIDEMKNYTIPISRSTNSDVAQLTNLVRSLEPRPGKPKNRAELFELTNMCISSLKQQLVALDEEWDFHKNPWGGDELGSIDDIWDYVHSSHGRATFNNKELANVVELIYGDHAIIEELPLQPESDDQEDLDSAPEPVEKDGHLNPPHRTRRRHLHTEPSSDPESYTGSHTEKQPRHKHRSRRVAERLLQREQEQEEHLEGLRRHRERKEKEEAEQLHAKGLQLQGQELERYTLRQQRRLRREESAQEYLDHLRRNRIRRERKEQRRLASEKSPREEYRMSGGL